MESGTHDQEERARAQTIAEASDRSSIKISDLLAKFEPLPKESETVRTRAESFSLEQNKSKRRSINLSAWKEEISIKALSEKFEQKAKEAPVFTSKLPVEFEKGPIGPAIAERKALLSNHRLVNDEQTSQEEKSKQEASPSNRNSRVMKLVANLENISNSLRGSRRSKRFSIKFFNSGSNSSTPSSTPPDQSPSQSPLLTPSESHSSAVLKPSLLSSSKPIYSDQVTENLPEKKFEEEHKFSENQNGQSETGTNVVSGSCLEKEGGILITKIFANEFKKDIENIQESSSASQTIWKSPRKSPRGDYQQEAQQNNKDKEKEKDKEKPQREKDKGSKDDKKKKKKAKKEKKEKSEKKEIAEIKVSENEVFAKKVEKSEIENLPNDSDAVENKFGGEHVQKEPVCMQENNEKPEKGNREDEIKRIEELINEKFIERSQGREENEEDDEESNFMDFDKLMNLLNASNEPTPKDIQLTSQNIDDSSLAMLLSSLSENFRINLVEILNLNGNDFTERGAIDLFDFLLKSSFPPPPSLDSELDSFPSFSLHTLDIGWNLIGSNGATSLAEFLKINATLVNLNIDGNDIGIDGAIAIAEGLKFNSKIKKLEMKDNSISDRGASAISYSLRNNKTLTHLDLTCNLITPSGIQQIAKYLIADPDYFFVMPPLFHINDEHLTMQEEDEVEHNALETLILNSNSVEDEGGYFIADSLALNTTLISLQLRNCSICTSGVGAITDSLINRKGEYKLTELDLNLNVNTIESEIKLNDLLLSNENLYVEWKDPTVQYTWDTDSLDKIVLHYGIEKILGNILNGFSLAPLIDNLTLLGHLEIHDIDIAQSFITEALQPNVIEKGLEMLSFMIRRGLPTEEADDFDEYEGEDLYLEENEDELEELTPLVQSIYHHLPHLIKLLVTPSPAAPTTSGILEHFGRKRLAIVDLINALMDEEGSSTINQLLLDHKLPRIILNLFKRFPRNNILHKHIQVFVRVCLRTESLRLSLFEDFNILDLIISSCNDQWSKPPGVREPYSGYLKLILDDLRKFSFDEFVGDYFDNHDKYQSFMETTYSNYIQESVYTIHPKK